MKITQAMRDMAIKLNVPLEDLENDIWAQRYIKAKVNDLKPRKPSRHLEPSDASGYTQDFSCLVIRKR